MPLLGELGGMAGLTVVGLLLYAMVRSRGGRRGEGYEVSPPNWLSPTALPDREVEWAVVVRELRLACNTLSRSPASQITAITMLFPRSAGNGDADRAFRACRLIAEEYRLREETHLETGTMTIRITRRPD